MFIPIELNCPGDPGTFTPGSKECGECDYRTMCAGCAIAFCFISMFKVESVAKKTTFAAANEVRDTPRNVLFSMQHLKANIMRGNREDLADTMDISIALTALERSISDLLLVDEMLRRGELKLGEVAGE